MTERLHFFEEAADEIEEARRWYRERSALAERAFRHEVDHAVEAILDDGNQFETEPAIYGFLAER